MIRSVSSYSALLTRSSVKAIHSPRRTLANKISALSLTSKKRKGKKITMVTAYDYPSALAVTRAQMDIILIGDSVGMVELGYDNTQPVSVQTMIHHCRSVKRGVENCTDLSQLPLLVGDLPFGSYEFDNTDVALENAYRMVKDGGVDAVKLEVSAECCFRVTVVKFGCLINSPYSIYDRVVAQPALVPLGRL